MPVKAARAGDPKPPEGRVPGRRPMTRLCTRPVRIRGRSRAPCRAGRGRSRRGGMSLMPAGAGPPGSVPSRVLHRCPWRRRCRGDRHFPQEPVGEEALRTSAATPPRPSTSIGPIRGGRLRASLVSPLTLPPGPSTAPPTGATSRGPAPVLPSSPGSARRRPLRRTALSPWGWLRGRLGLIRLGLSATGHVLCHCEGVGNLFAALGVPLNTLWKGLRWIRAQATWGASRRRRLVPRGVHPSRHVPTCRCGGWCVRMSGRGWPSCSRARVRGVCVLPPWCFWCRACGGSRCRCWSSIKWPGLRGGLPVVLFPVIREGGSWTMRC